MDIVGHRSTSNLSALFSEATGKWKVLNVVTQGICHTNGEWEDKEITTEVEDVDLDKALSDVMMTVSLYLESVHGDMFADSGEDKELVL